MLLALSLTAAPGAASAAAADLFYERAVMSAADARCRLFEPDVAAALKVAEAQARGAALRAGASNAALAQVAAQARARAGGVPCGSKDVAVAAGRVRGAFAGYSRLVRMDFPGDVAGWSADRSFAVEGPTWKLSQSTRLGGAPLRVGLAGRRGERARLLAVAAFGAVEPPYAARLVLRDPARAPEPYLAVMRVSTSAHIPLQDRVAPRAASRIFLADDRAPAEPTLAPRPALAFRFPASAVDALAALDPREAVTVEFIYSGRGADTVRSALLEVGDFAAGRAFIDQAR